MRNLISSLTILVLLLVFVAGQVLALRVPTRGVVNCSALHVRTGPSTNYEILDLIYEGTSVTILDTAGSWYKVNVGSHQGRYVHGAYIDVTDYDEVDDEQAAQRPHVTLQQTDPHRPATQNIDSRVFPTNVN